MSGLEHYDTELAKLDHEIRHYAAVCGLDLTHRHEVEACLEKPNEAWGDDKAHQTLQGLLFLRLKLETEMLGEGLIAPPLDDSAPLDSSQST